MADVRTILVTGASDGIGAKAAGLLAAGGARVLVAGRSAERTRAVAERIGGEAFLADFAHLDDVRRLADEVIAATDGRLDVLASNAGGMFGDRTITDDGNELTMQVNHLAPMLLVDRLQDALAAAGGFVVQTASEAHRWAFGGVDVDDLRFEHRYSPAHAYGVAKLANILFVRGIERHLGHRGIHAVAFHPGVVATSFASESTSPLRLLYGGAVRRLLTTDDEAGATLAGVATGRPGVDWPRGGYLRGLARSRPWRASDPATIDALWDRSLALVRSV